MRSIKLISVAAFIFSLVSMAAEARGGSSGGDEWVFNPAFMYLYSNTTDGGSTSTTSRVLADISLGYKFSSPIYLGGLYSYDSTSTTSSSSTTTDTFGSYGPSLGLLTDNVYLIFTYFVASTETTSNHSYSSGSGFQVVLGYKFDMGSSWGLGPQVNYRSLAYTKDGNSTVDHHYTTLLPYVSLWFTF